MIVINIERFHHYRTNTKVPNAKMRFFKYQEIMTKKYFAVFLNIIQIRPQKCSSFILERAFLTSSSARFN